MGTLYWRKPNSGPKAIGQVLLGQTRFWVGPAFGFGYYRAGEMAVAFVFDAQRAGINDRVDLPELRKRIIGARAYLGERLCWLLTEIKEAGVIKHYCSVLDAKGNVVAFEQATEGDDHWLGRSVHGKVAAGKSLYAATDEGLARIDLTKHGAEQVRLFPDTEPYVEENCELLLGTTGIIVVHPKTIQLLEMA
jgi:H/ACA ribonucleoprotein complex subunit 3